MIINYFVLGDQVVMTPFFAGSEPVTATSGKFKGTTILQEEQAAGLAMISALDASQRQKATVEVSKTGNNNMTEAFKDNVVLDYAGVRAGELSDRRSANSLYRLVKLFVDNMDDGHARVKMDEVRRHLDDTWFAWIGATDADAVFYFRIQSPVILIEFDHQRPANLRHLAADPSKPIAAAHSRRRADAERQRLRQGSAAPALFETSTLASVMRPPVFLCVVFAIVAALSGRPAGGQTTSPPPRVGTGTAAVLPDGSLEGSGDDGRRRD